MFGCSSYGKKGCCPPNVPSVVECKDFFASYQTTAIFHLTKQVQQEWRAEPFARLQTGFCSSEGYSTPAIYFNCMGRIKDLEQQVRRHTAAANANISLLPLLG